MYQKLLWTSLYLLEFSVVSGEGEEGGFKKKKEREMGELFGSDGDVHHLDGVMVLWVYTYVKIYQTVPFTCSLLYVSYTQIKL